MVRKRKHKHIENNDDKIKQQKNSTFEIEKSSLDLKIRNSLKINGFISQEENINGKIVIDLKKKKWRIGESIGKGSFGQIYGVSDQVKINVTRNNAKFIIKVEPHSNGPLFVEIHCLMNIGKSTENLKSTGIPKYIASGSFMWKNERHRFLILPRYSCDLSTIINKSRLNIESVSKLGIHILNILENLHNSGYCHSDIKAENLMVSYHTKLQPLKVKSVATTSKEIVSTYLLRNRTNSIDINKPTLKKPKKKNIKKQCPKINKSDELFLIDYGLATKFINSFGSHKPNITDQRKAHNGTLEFTSRDAHNGLHCRRSDLECLGYNLLKWNQGFLPWKDLAAAELCDKVHWMKEYLMSNPEQILEDIYGNEVPEFLGEFLSKIKELEFDERPKYNILKSMLQKNFQVEKNNFFILDIKEIQNTSETYEAVNVKDSNNNMDMKTIMKNMGVTTPLREMNFNRVSPKLLRSKSIDNLLDNSNKIKSSTDLRKFSWQKTLSENPEKIIRNRSLLIKDEENTPMRKYTGRPTYAITEIENRLKFLSRLEKAVEG